MRKVLFLFGQLNDDDVEWMLANGAKRTIPVQGVLIQQGVVSDFVFIVLEGRLAVWLKPRRGPEREIALLNAGEIVGEMSFVDARPPSATVRAVEEATVFAISKSALSARLAANEGFAARFYRDLAIFLSTTVRERHRDLAGVAPEASEQASEEIEEDDADELDANVLDGVYLAGERFDRMLKRVLVT